MTEREKIAARIRALLQKTVDNGCTEDEAVAAAAKAAELLQRYNLTVDEVEMRASPFSRHTEQHSDPVGERLWKVAAAIGELTGARFWTSPVGAPVEITFFGFDHEVQIARYLLEICTRAMRNEAAKLERTVALLVESARRRRILPFLDGMADRLARRIRDLVPPQPTGTGIMVLHRELIDAALKAEGVALENRKTRNSRDLEPSYLEGQLAADRVSLNKGLSGSQAARALLQ